MIYPWHQSTWSKFIHARSQHHLPHALLLSGDNGIGKLDLAKTIVKSLLCANSKNHTDNYHACNCCQACKTYESGANPDYLQIELLEGKQQIAVDQIRELSKFLNYTSSFNGYRVILLNPVERMNKNAANSLLKSLEEPTKDTVLVLVTSQLSQLLPTIKSRCQLLSIPTPNQNQAIEWLKQHAPHHSNPELSLELANGKPLQALDINEDELESREELATDILDILLQHKSITEIAKKWEKFNLSTLLDWQIRWLQSFLKNRDQVVPIQIKIKEQISATQQWVLYQQLIDQKRLVHTSVNTLIFIENMLISWLQAIKSKS